MTLQHAFISPHQTSDPAAEQLRSGMAAERPAASRAGYLPIPLDQLLIAALHNLPIYLRTGQTSAPRYTLYTSESSRFTARNSDRLQDAGVRFVYIPMTHHNKFRQQVEEELIHMVTDPDAATAAKAALVYQTSLELINDILGEQGIAKNLPASTAFLARSQKLVVSDSDAFAQLFATAQHDFYTATHMVNVGTWMTALAAALGETNPNALNSICTAGMLHDVGKCFIPESLLNKHGALSDNDWQCLREHPQRGARHLRQQGVTDPIVLAVTQQHHERLDGNGYPERLTTDRIHNAAKICAVVDSFDAMTACRPFKNSVKPIGEAAAILLAESGTRYDPAMVAAWLDLLKNSTQEGLTVEPISADPNKLGRRNNERFGIDCPLRVHELSKAAPRNKDWAEAGPANGKAHNISKDGLGFLTKSPIKTGTYVRAYLRGGGTLENLVLEGQVVRCRNYKDGWHEVGVKLCTPGVQEAASAAVIARG